MTVLVVRPENKCEQTCSYFRNQGTECAGLPLMTLESNEAGLAQFHQALRTLLPGDWVISTSTFASKLVANELKQLNNQDNNLASLNHIEWFAVGETSAQDLMHEDLSFPSKVHFPEVETSEGLLAHLEQFSTYDTKVEVFPEKKRKIIILKGEGGRTLLRDSLAAKGHQVMESDLYKRKIVEPAMLSKSWYQSHISCVVVTSGELLQATFQFFSGDNQWLTLLPWVVVSKRMANIAKDYGIKTIFVSGAANNKALFSTVSVACASHQ